MSTPSYLATRVTTIRHQSILACNIHKLCRCRIQTEDFDPFPSSFTVCSFVAPSFSHGKREWTSFLGLGHALCLMFTTIISISILVWQWYPAPVKKYIYRFYFRQQSRTYHGQAAPPFFGRTASSALSNIGALASTRCCLQKIHRHLGNDRSQLPQILTQARPTKIPSSHALNIQMSSLSNWLYLESQHQSSMDKKVWATCFGCGNASFVAPPKIVWWFSS